MAPKKQPRLEDKPKCPVPTCTAQFKRHAESVGHFADHTEAERLSIADDDLAKCPGYKRCAVTGCSKIFWTKKEVRPPALYTCSSHRGGVPQPHITQDSDQPLPSEQVAQELGFTEDDFSVFARWKVHLPKTLPDVARRAVGTFCNWLLRQRHEVLMVGLYVWPKIAFCPDPARPDEPVEGCAIAGRLKELQARFVGVIAQHVEIARAQLIAASASSSDAPSSDDIVDAAVEDAIEEDPAGEEFGVDDTDLRWLEQTFGPNGDWYSSKPPVSEKDVARICRLCDAGCFARAAAALNAGPLAPYSADVADQLRSLHPKASDPPLPKRDPIHIALPKAEHMVKILSTFKAGTAAGPSGLKADWLKQLTLTPGVRVGELLAKVLWILLSGRCPEYLHRCYAGARLLALPKDPAPAVRPVAIGEVLRRLAGKFAAQTVLPRIVNRLLYLHQLAVGVPDGTTTALHFLQFITEKFPNADILKTDLTNAFNMIRRKFIVKEADATGCPLFSSFVFFLYGSPSFLFFDRFIVSSEEGAQQGCPLAGIVFALVLARFAEAHIAPLDLLGCAFVADDGAYVGSISTLAAVAQAFTTEGPKFGLHLNLSKSRLFLCSSHPASPVIPPILSSCQLGSSDNISFVKCVVGSASNRHAHAKKLAHRIATRTLQITAISEVDPQVAVWLSRSSGGFAAAVYFLRGMDVEPSTWLPIDLAVRDVLTLLVPSCPAIAVRQAELPVRFGGLGFRSCVQHGRAAYTAAAASAATRFGALLGRVPSSDAIVPIPSSDAKPVTQHQLSEQIDQEAARSLIAAFTDLGDERSKTRITALASWGTASWLAPAPEAAAVLRLSPHAFRSLLAYRLGCPFLQEGQSLLCPKCRKANVDMFGDHLLACMAKGKRTSIHHAIRDTVMRFAQKALLNPRPEPNSGWDTRADLSFMLGGNLVTYDFVSSAPLLSPFPKFPARQVEFSERAKAAHLARSAQGDVVPVAFDLFGGTTKISRGALDDVARAFSIRQDNPRTAVLRFWAEVWATINTFTAEELSHVAVTLTS